MTALSVVMPVRNEARSLPRTIDALIFALRGSGFDAELVLVDDGSTDGSAAVARRAVGDAVPLRIVTLCGSGRLAARAAGLEAAGADLTLLLDARVRLAPGSLAFVRERVEAGDRVWNGHVSVQGEDAFSVFWQLLAELAWRDYFDKPRTTSFGAEDFDRYPKGAGCLLAPRLLLLDSFASFTTKYSDVRHANDDTPVLRRLAERERIWISPDFSCRYVARTTPGRFLRHAVRRGMVFLDGHGTPQSRFFPAVFAFFPLSGMLAGRAVRRPVLLPAAAAACGVAAAAYGAAAGRSRREIRVLLEVTPLYAAGHAIGMWRGALELARGVARR